MLALRTFVLRTLRIEAGRDPGEFELLLLLLLFNSSIVRGELLVIMKIKKSIKKKKKEKKRGFQLLRRSVFLTERGEKRREGGEG